MKTKNIFKFALVLGISVIMTAPVFAQQEPKTANEKLLEAVYKADKTGVNRAIKQGADVFMTDENGRNLLHLLVEEPNYDLSELKLMNKLIKKDDAKRSAIAQKLIDLHVDVNAKDNNGNTPLMFAAENLYEKVFETYVNNNAKIDDVDNDGNTILLKTMINFIEDTDLHISYRSEYIKIVKFLIENATDVIDVKIKYDVIYGNIPKNEVTALHIAAWELDKNVVELLTKAGAKKNIKDNYRRTAYDYAKIQYNDYKKKCDKLINRESKGKIISNEDIERYKNLMKVAQEIMNMVNPKTKEEMQKEFMKAFEENAVYKPAWQLPKY